MPKNYNKAESGDGAENSNPWIETEFPPFDDSREQNLNTAYENRERGETEAAYPKLDGESDEDYKARIDHIQEVSQNVIDTAEEERQQELKGYMDEGYDPNADFKNDPGAIRLEDVDRARADREKYAERNERADRMISGYQAKLDDARARLDALNQARGGAAPEAAEAADMTGNMTQAEYDEKKQKLEAEIASNEARLAKAESLRTPVATAEDYAKQRAFELQQEADAKNDPDRYAEITKREEENKDGSDDPDGPDNPDGPDGGKPAEKTDAEDTESKTETKTDGGSEQDPDTSKSDADPAKKPESQPASGLAFHRRKKRRFGSLNTAPAAKEQPKTDAEQTDDEQSQPKAEKTDQPAQTERADANSDSSEQKPDAAAEQKTEADTGTADFDAFKKQIDEIKNDEEGLDPQYRLGHDLHQLNSQLEQIKTAHEDGKMSDLDYKKREQYILKSKDAAVSAYQDNGGGHTITNEMAAHMANVAEQNYLDYEEKKIQFENDHRIDPNSLEVQVGKAITNKDIERGEVTLVVDKNGNIENGRRLRRMEVLNAANIPYLHPAEAPVSKKAEQLAETVPTLKELYDKLESPIKEDNDLDRVIFAYLSTGDVDGAAPEKTDEAVLEARQNYKKLTTGYIMSSIRAMPQKVAEGAGRMIANFKSILEKHQDAAGYDGIHKVLAESKVGQAQSDPNAFADQLINDVIGVSEDGDQRIESGFLDGTGNFGRYRDQQLYLNFVDAGSMYHNADEIMKTLADARIPFTISTSEKKHGGNSMMVQVSTANLRATVAAMRDVTTPRDGANTGVRVPPRLTSVIGGTLIGYGQLTRNEFEGNTIVTDYLTSRNECVSFAVDDAFEKYVDRHGSESFEDPDGGTTTIAEYYKNADDDARRKMADQIIRGGEGGTGISRDAYEDFRRDVRNAIERSFDTYNIDADKFSTDASTYVNIMRQDTYDDNRKHPNNRPGAHPVEKSGLSLAELRARRDAAAAKAADGAAA